MHWSKGKYLLAALVGIYLIGVGVGWSGCTYVGKNDATWEQKFFEVDQTAIATLESAAVALRVIREQGVELPDKLRTALKVSVQSLELSRGEVRKWVDACKIPADCPPAERIELGIDNVTSATTVVGSIVMEVKGYE